MHVVLSELVSINEVKLRRAGLHSVPGVGYLSRYVTSHPGQLSLAFVARRNEYQPKGGDTLRLGSKGRYVTCVGGR